ncbi:MAG TPA: hypothetical protein VI306_14920 [Pyrinomonadaceae bacterium]
MRQLLILALITTLTFSGLTFAQQTKQAIPTASMDRLDIYRQYSHLSRQKDFQSLLKTVGVKNVDAVIAWLDDNDAQLSDAVTSAAHDEVKSIQDERIAERRRAMEERADAEPAPEPEPSATPITRARTRRRQSNHASYGPKISDDAPVVTVSRKVDRVESSGATEKSYQDGDVTITQGQTEGVQGTAEENGIITITLTSTEYVDAVNKPERSSVRSEVTKIWEASIPACPDANGLLSGHEKITSFGTKKLTTPQTIAILKDEFVTDIVVTGNVNDAAELSTFDLKGRTTRTISGFDRAHRLGLLGDTDIVDGSSSVEVKLIDNKVANETQPRDEPGRSIDVTGGSDDMRVGAAAGISAGWLYGSNAVRLARENWRNGGCVEVKMSAPKIKLRPGEQVNVATETVHKKDGAKIAAMMTKTAATDLATPDQQHAATRAVFTLTAPKKGSKGMIMVESVSRRGIASEMMRFQEDIPGQKPNKGGWVGQVTATTKYHKDVPKKASGAMVSANEYTEWEIVAKFDVTGIVNPIGAFDNGYFADGNVNFTQTNHRDFTYATNLMSCNDSIVNTGQTQNFDVILKGEGGQRTTVYVAKPFIEFTTQDVNGSRIYRTVYNSQCQPYNNANSKNTEEPVQQVGGSYSYRIESPVDPRQPNVLQGSVTVENEDGSKTTYSWNLTKMK